MAADGECGGRQQRRDEGQPDGAGEPVEQGLARGTGAAGLDGDETGPAVCDGQGPHAPGHDVLQPGGDDEAHLGTLQAAHEGDQVLGDDRADRHDGVDALGVQGLGDVLGAAHGLSRVEGAVLPGGQVAHDEEAVHGMAAQLGEHGLGTRAHDDEGATQGVPLEAAAAQPPGLDGASGDGQEELGRQSGQQGGPGDSGQVGQQQGHRDAHGGRGDKAARAGRPRRRNDPCRDRPARRRRCRELPGTRR